MQTAAARIPVCLVLLAWSAVHAPSGRAAETDPAPAPCSAPPAEALTALEPFVVKEDKSRGFYGITNDYERDAHGVPRGARIRTVLPGAPAAEAGLQRNDVILKIDGRGPGEWTFAGRAGQKRTLLVERYRGKTRRLVTVVVTLRFFTLANSQGPMFGGRVGAEEDFTPGPFDKANADKIIPPTSPSAKSSATIELPGGGSRNRPIIGERPLPPIRLPRAMEAPPGIPPRH